MTEFDFVVVGSGPVGACVANLLSQLSISVALLDHQSLAALTENRPDARAIALSYPSEQILRAADIWSHLEHSANPLKQIEVSVKKNFHRLSINAAEIGRSHLGTVIDLSALRIGVAQALAKNQNLNFFWQTEIKQAEFLSDGVLLTVKNNLDEVQTLKTRWLILADGGGWSTTLYKKLGITPNEKKFPEKACLLTVRTASDHVHHRALEQFDFGQILAALPMTEHRLGLVYLLSPPEAESFSKLEEKTLLKTIQEKLAGNFIVEEILTPVNNLSLIERQVDVVPHPTIISIGNAAQICHPLAAQGLNLGMRDAAVLFEVFAEAYVPQDKEAQLKTWPFRYSQKRKPDQTYTLSVPGRIQQFFNPRLHVLRGLYDVGLGAFDLTPFTKRELVRRLSGDRSGMPRLAMGISVKEVLRQYG